MSLARARRAAAALLIAGGAASLAGVAAAPGGALPPLGFSFREVAKESGLDAVTVFGGRDANRYLLETTGCGVAFLDYDDDGWLDVFLVNGTTLEGFLKGRSRRTISTATAATAPSTTSRGGPAWPRAAGARGRAPAIMTTTATWICS